jgi:hypothetical protein
MMEIFAPCDQRFSTSFGGYPKSVKSAGMDFALKKYVSANHSSLQRRLSRVINQLV